MMRYLVLFVLLGNALLADACTCGFEALSAQKILKSDLVILGKVVAKEVIQLQIDKNRNIDLPIIGRQRIKYTFEVKKWIYGPEESKTVEVYSEYQSSACGVNYKIGSTLYLFAYQSEGGYSTNLCSGNILRSEVTKKQKRVFNQFGSTNGEVKICSEHGKVSAKGQMINGVPQGRWVFFFSDGKVKSQVNFEDGKKQGPWVHYRWDGRQRTISRIDRYVDGVKVRTERR